MQKHTPPDKLSRIPNPATTRINLTIAKALLKIVDEAARDDYTTRSDIIRTALLWYLRPQGRELDHANPELILATLKRRHSQAELRKMLKG